MIGFFKRISRSTRGLAAGALVWAVLAVSVLFAGSLASFRGAQLAADLRAAEVHARAEDPGPSHTVELRRDRRAATGVLPHAKRRAAPARVAVLAAALPLAWPLAAPVPRTASLPSPAPRAGLRGRPPLTGPRTAAERCAALQVHRC